MHRSSEADIDEKTGEIKRHNSPDNTDLCTYFYRENGVVCAEKCLSPYIGICPRSICVFMGKLKRGQCFDMGYVKFEKILPIHAGPCGIMNFDLFSKEPKKSSGKFFMELSASLPTQISKTVEVSRQERLHTEHQGVNKQNNIKTNNNIFRRHAVLHHLREWRKKHID
jgi:hypothetical protein